MDALDEKEKLEVCFTNLMERVTEWEDAMAKEEGTFVELTTKLKETSKRVDVAA